MRADPDAVAAADRGARVWNGPDQGPVVIGSQAHKQLCCRMFAETFNAYRPSIIDWPHALCGCP